MAQQPKNPKLWQMIIAQARARFATYPSPAASHWVHDQYIKSGGQFFDTVQENERKRAIAAYHEAVSRHHEKHSDHKSDAKKNEKRKKTK